MLSSTRRRTTRSMKLIRTGRMFKKQPPGTNFGVFAPSDRDLEVVEESGKLYKKDKEFPWLTKKERNVLNSGGYFDMEGVVHDNLGRVRCTSIVKSTGNRCKNFADSGQTSCVWHGGMSSKRDKAIYSPFIEDGSLTAIYENSLEEDNLAGIRNELGLLRSVLAGALQNVRADEEGMTPHKAGQIAKVISEIRQLINTCMTSDIKMGQLIDIGKVTIVIAQLCKILERHISDKEVLFKIAAEFDQIRWPGALTTTPTPINEEPSPEVRERPRGILERGVRNDVSNDRPDQIFDVISE